jgi:DNA repair protein RecO
MREHVTDAIVLGRRPHREWDTVADLFTESLGRVEARVVGGTRSLSKFSPHLDPLNRVQVRLVAKNALTLADITTRDRHGSVRNDRSALRRAIEVTYLVRKLVPRGSPDPRLWAFFERLSQCTTPSVPEFLSLLGYDPRHAQCETCGRNVVSHFVVCDQAFSCIGCHVKFPMNEVVYIR